MELLRGLAEAFRAHPLVRLPFSNLKEGAGLALTVPFHEAEALVEGHVNVLADMVEHALDPALVAPEKPMPAAFEGQTVEQALLENGLYVGRALAQDDARVAKRLLKLVRVHLDTVDDDPVPFADDGERATAYEGRLFEDDDALPEILCQESRRRHARNTGADYDDVAAFCTHLSRVLASTGPIAPAQLSPAVPS